MSSQRLLIRNGFVVSMDPDVGDVPSGDVLVEDGKIAEIGPGLEASAAEEVDATRLAVIGMGKAGARELNYVSDVDVIYVAESADEASVSTSRALSSTTRRSYSSTSRRRASTRSAASRSGRRSAS